jgi:hypothetical protein
VTCRFHAELAEPGAETAEKNFLAFGERTVERIDPDPLEFLLCDLCAALRDLCVKSGAETDTDLDAMTIP